MKPRINASTTKSSPREEERDEEQPSEEDSKLNSMSRMAISNDASNPQPEANALLPQSTDTTISMSFPFDSERSLSREQLVEATPVLEHASTTHHTDTDELEFGERRQRQSPSELTNPDNVTIIVQARPPKAFDVAHDLVHYCRGRRLFLFLGCAGILLVLGGVTALVLHWTRSNSAQPTQNSIHQDSSPILPDTTGTITQSPTPFPTVTPTLLPTLPPSTTIQAPLQTWAPTSTQQGYMANLLPNYTLLALQDPDSPQSHAMEWLLREHDGIGTSTSTTTNWTDDRLVQRFALATLYFATRGIGWRQQRYWLWTNNHYNDNNYEEEEEDWITECDWWSSYNNNNYHDNNNNNGNNNNNVCDSQGHLIRLALQENILRGTLPNEIALLTRLQEIRFFADVFVVAPQDKPDRALTGTLPVEWMSSLTNLVVLDLSRNALSGPIPTEIGFLTALQSLKLLENNFNSTLPTELFGLSNLEELWIYGNQLEGTLPTEIGSLEDDQSNLRLLAASQNRFHGTLPTELGKLKQLKQLKMSRNLLTGTIPKEIALMSQLGDLWLDFNMLTGTIHTEFGKLTQLTNLWLGSNDLSGTIPTELARLTSMRNMDLSQNYMTGTIPTHFGVLGQVCRVILDDTALTGTVPEGLCRNANSYPLFYRIFVDCQKVSCDCRCCWCNCTGSLP